MPFRYPVLWGLLLLLSALLIGCGEDSSSKDDQPPSQPVWVDRSPVGAYAQHGVRPEPVASDNAQTYLVHLEWKANPEDDVVGYRIWRYGEHQNPREFYVVKDLRMGIDLPYGQAVYTWVDRGDDENGHAANLLAPDSMSGASRGYYWQVQAYDSANNASAWSRAEYFRLVSNPFNLSVGQTGGNLYLATWQYAENVFADSPRCFYVRAYSQEYGPDSVVFFEVANTYAPDCRKNMLLSGALHAGWTYVCQVNAIVDRPNSEHADSVAGSAAYTIFTYEP